ncbi:MAG: Gfo/Idh/MocA family protein [Pirellulales bacterium]
MKLRLGVVNLGTSWQSRYAPALRTLNEWFEVRAIYEPVGHRAEQAAREFSARTEDGFRALTQREDIDAIAVLAPAWHGWLPILAACDAGKAVYCAADLDLDPEQVRYVKQRVEETGIAFTAELPCRLAPATLRLKELIATQLGRPRLLFCHRRYVVEPAGSSKSRAWRMGDLVEAIDWCRYLVDRQATSVVGIAHRCNEARCDDDYQMLSLDFAADHEEQCGAVAQISCGRYIPEEWHEAASFRPPADLQVACEKGIAFIDLPSKLVWFDNAGRHMESLESERPVDEQLLRQFHRSVTSLVRDTSSLEDAYRAFSIAVHAQRSRDQGRRIELAF